MNSAKKFDISAIELDGVLSTLILPLTIPVPDSPPPVREDPLNAHSALFAAGQRPARRRPGRSRKQDLAALFDPADREVDVWNDVDGEDDLGLGLPFVIAHRVIVLEGPEVRFGASDLTMGELETQAQVDARTWLLPPALGFTLWWTRYAVTLTIERLDALEPSAQGALLLRPDVAADVAKALPTLLRGTALGAEVRLANCFGDQPSWNPRGARARRQLRALWQTPIHEILIRGRETIRGKSVSEAFLAITAPLASNLTGDLYSAPPPEESGSFADHQDDQESGAQRSWHPLTASGVHEHAQPQGEDAGDEICQRSSCAVCDPATGDPASAIRDDYRAALINLEALSVRHCYRGGATGGGWIAAAIPVVAHRAATERDYMRVVRTFRARRDIQEQLAVVEAARTSMLDRRLTIPLVGPERFTAWTTPTQLASALWQATTGHSRELDLNTGMAAEAVSASLERLEQRRRQSLDRWIQRLSPVAAVSALVGIYAALTSVPDPATQAGLFSAVPDALRVTVALVLVGVVVGVLIDSLLNRKTRKLRP